MYILYRLYIRSNSIQFDSMQFICKMSCPPPELVQKCPQAIHSRRSLRRFWWRSLRRSLRRSSRRSLRSLPHLNSPRTWAPCHGGRGARRTFANTFVSITQVPPLDSIILNIPNTTCIQLFMYYSCIIRK